MEIFSFPYDICYNALNNSISIRWSGLITLDVRKRGMKHALKLLNIMECKKVLSDESCMIRNWDEDFTLEEVKWHKDLQAKNVTRLAIVASEIDHMSALRFKEYVNGAMLNKLKILSFSNEKIAIIWLNSNSY